MTYDELVKYVIPAGHLEDRQVAKVVLQPSRLGLQHEHHKQSAHETSSIKNMIVLNGREIE